MRWYAFKAGRGADGMPTALSIRVVTSSISAHGRTQPFPEDKDLSRRRWPGWRQRLQGPQHARRRGHQEHASAGLVLARARQPTSTSSRWRASSTRWRPPARSIPSSCGASCSGKAGLAQRCWTPLQRKGGWGKPMPPGTGRGIAIAPIPTASAPTSPRSRSSPQRRGQGRPRQVAFDPRYMVNPLTIVEQMEGG